MGRDPCRGRTQEKDYEIIMDYRNYVFYFTCLFLSNILDRDAGISLEKLF